MEWCLNAASWEWESRSSRGLSRSLGGGRCSLLLLSGSGSWGSAHFHWHMLTEGAQTPRDCFSRGLQRYCAEGRSPVSTEAGTSRPPLGLPRRRCREGRCTTARGAEEPRFSDGHPDATDCVSTVCSDSPRLWPGLPRQRRRGWSRGCLLGLCWWSGFAAVVLFCALWLEPCSYYQKAFNLSRLSFFGSFSCKEEAFFLFWSVCAHWRVWPAGFSVIQSMIWEAKRNSRNSTPCFALGPKVLVGLSFLSTSQSYVVL